MPTQFDTILVRRGLNSDRLNYIPSGGELAFATDTKMLYIGDGVTLGGILINNSSGFSGYSSGVSTLNGLLNNIIISGVSGANIVTSGQYILVSASGASFSGLTSGQAATLFYPLSNPSGFITGQTGNFISASQTGAFQPSGNYYPANNPSGFITGLATGNLTGQFYPLVGNPSGFLTGFNSGQYITQSQTGTLQPSGNYYLASNPSGFITGISTGNLTGQFYPLNANPSGYLTGFSSGQYVTQNQTGVLYPATNPSGFITGVATGNLTGQFYPLSSNPSGYLTGFNSGQYLLLSQSGQFYPASNPSGFITGLATGNFVVSNQTGNFITSSQTGQFQPSGNYYPANNPSGFITGVPTGNLTGQFYPFSSNPSGYITGFNSGLYVLNSQTGTFVTSGGTGVFVTTGQTGLFYPNTNPSGFISSVPTGNLTGQFYPLNSNPSGYLTGFNSGLYTLNSQTGAFAGTGIANTFAAAQTFNANVTMNGATNNYNGNSYFASSLVAIGTIGIRIGTAGNFVKNLIVGSGILNNGSGLITGTALTTRGCLIQAFHLNSGVAANFGALYGYCTVAGSGIVNSTNSLDNDAFYYTATNFQ